MCEKIGENETLNLKNNKIEMSSQKERDVEYCQMYERRMYDYMKSIPFIPPTQFELKLRHNEIKNEIIKQYKSSAQNPNTGRPLISKLDNLIEKVFVNLSKKNLKEYKTCQAGFIIGWKRDDKPKSKPETTDDRF